MRIENDIKLDYSDVLIRPKRSTITSRGDVDLERNFHFRHGGTWSGIPIVAANMDTVGTASMANTLASEKMLTCLHKHIQLGGGAGDIEGHAIDYVSFTMGLNTNNDDSIWELIERYPDVKFVTLDVANGYMERFVGFVRHIRDCLPDKIIIAGNVVSSEMTEALILAGADIVKVGIGSGSVCTTRKMSGVGYPQLSAVIECSDAAHGLGGHVMADGGCVCPGDIAKAFGAGADFVMLGGMLAGHDECDGENVVDLTTGEITHKVFYGMSSEAAMDKYHGGVATHRAAEGKRVEVPYRGNIGGTVQQILGGVRSACAYIGARTLRDIPKCTTFVRVNRQLNTFYGDE